jgi:hypothetical protein
VSFQLLTRDAAPIGPSALIPGTLDQVSSPDIAWNGSEWGLVWVQNMRVGLYWVDQPHFQRLASDGTPIGTPLNLYSTFNVASWVRITHAPGSGWAIVGGAYGSISIQVIGAGTGPFLIATPLTGSAGGWPSAAGAPDGRFGVLYDRDRFQIVNADGSVTTPASTVTQLVSGSLAHDGTTWVASGIRDTPFMPTLTMLRGAALAGVTSISEPTSRDGRGALAIAGDGTATAVWTDPPYMGTAGLRAVRARLPAGTGAAVQHTRTQTIMPDSTVRPPALPDVVHVGADRYVVAWPDGRWGQQEVYALAVDVPACP